VPSQRHETIVELIRQQPELIRSAVADASFRQDAEGHFQVVQASETFGEAKGAARAADLVLRRIGASGSAPPHSFIVEVQLGVDPEKLLSWPLYATAERARQQGGHVQVLVVTPSRAVARWASQPIALDPHNAYRVAVLGPEQFPTFETPEQAAESLGLAMLWALSQRHEGPELAAKAAHLVTLAARSKSDQVFVSCYDALRERLDQAALAALEKLMQLNPDNLATEFSRKHVTSGLVLGKREAVRRVLEARNLTPTQTIRERIDGTTDLDLLDEWLTKAATIGSLDELFED
jgi:hypothetical protein